MQAKSGKHPSTWSGANAFFISIGWSFIMVWMSAAVSSAGTVSARDHLPGLAYVQ